MPPEKSPPGLVIKRHNIRIWCHDCDMSRLQRVVWEGHGTRLLSEVSNQPVVRKFLEAVPYIMNTIRDIHQAVVDNDLEALMKHSGDPVPPQALSSRDAHNMTVMHKAAGLGYGGILKYITDRYPQGINDVDNDGRTPLHYAAAMRDGQHTYDTLVSLGADESIVDNKNKTPAYYVNRPQEIDKNLFKTIPDAPRTPSSAYPPSWDWKLLDNYVITDVVKKTRKKNFRASTENISSKATTNTLSDSAADIKAGVMKASSTHEFIKDLPELDEGKITGNEIEPNLDEKEQENDNAKESEVVEDRGEPETKNDQEEVEHTNDFDENAGTQNQSTEEIAGDEANDHEPTSEDREFKQESHDEAEEHNEEIEENHEKTEENDVKADEASEQPPIDNSDKNNEEINDNLSDNLEEITKSSNENQDEDNEGHEDHASDTKVSHDIKENGHTEINSDDENESKVKPVEETPETDNDKENDINGDLGPDSQEIEQKDAASPSPSPSKMINGEDDDTTANEGNNNSSAANEDDDDVQVQGDTNSEYSDYNLKSTAEASTIGSAKIGRESNGRNTQESLIEGIINGEADQDSQDASIAQTDGSVHGEVLVVNNETDPEVSDLINNANMEMLATLVLNGEGSRLIGRRSGNAELQGFLDNVPSYMQKINQVHVAAREGNLKDLQSALDRRKFAIARDPMSPNGATPMHVATVHGKTNIIKYLGSRFPETLSAVDFEGRSALHYAAVLPDNGHYYNLMQQLGANSKDLDDNGNSAEDYTKNTSLLPFNQLLSDFEISEEAAKTIYSDKGPAVADNGQMDIPIFHTEEGRYLAKSLGDPLIKGLTEVANVKPKDPVAFLATFLHNFPEHEKPQVGTPVTESNIVVSQAAEVENEVAPVPAAAKLPRSATRTATRPHRPIDVVTVDPQPVTSPDAPETAFSSAKRDEHGQSMLHFAAARTHARNALFQLLQESDVSLGYRDELYRTARDVSSQANVPENTTEIDRFVLHLAARGETEKIMELLMEGYDHILDVVDEDGASITDVVAQRGDAQMTNLLASIPAFEESRDILLAAVRRGDLAGVRASIDAEGGRTLVRSHNSFGRTALHVAVLAENEEIVSYLAQTCPELLRIGDNLERTPLHYAMGVQKIESLSRVLIRSGAKRVLKDLKGRQPSYYFMNKSDILRLQEEEEIY